MGQADAVGTVAAVGDGSFFSKVSIAFCDGYIIFSTKSTTHPLVSMF